MPTNPVLQVSAKTTIFGINPFSFRVKTIIGVGLIEAFLLSFLLFQTFSYIQKTQQEYVENTAGVATKIFASAIENALLASDVATIEDYISSALSNKNILYVRVYANHALLAQGGDAQLLAQPFKADTFLSNLTDAVYDQSYKISFYDTEFGEIQLGYGVKALESSFDEAKNKFIVIALVELLASGLFSFVLGLYLTRQLKLLEEGANKVAQGDLDFTLDVSSNDEFGRLATTFNQMLGSIKYQKHLTDTANTQLHALLNIADGAYMLCDQDSNIVFVNQAFKDVFECYSIVDRKVEDFDALLKVMSVSEELVLVNDLLTNGELNAKDDKTYHDILKLDVRGEIRILERTIKLAKSDAQSSWLAIYMFDITEEFRMNEMRDNFLSHAAHEFRTPVTGIFGFTELLMARDYPPEQAKEIYKMIHQQSSRLITMITELLDLAQLDASHQSSLILAPVDLGGLVREVVANHPHNLHPVNHRVVIAPDLPLIKGDKDKLYRAIANIYNNAMKYSPKGTTVEVFVLQDKADQVSLLVNDKGQGLKPDELKQFGQRFWRADKSGKIPGTGLGVALSKEIIELHKGSFEVLSTYGKGTCIVISLPVDGHVEV